MFYSQARQFYKFARASSLRLFFVPNKNLVENSCENNTGLDTAYYRKLILKVVKKFIYGISQNKIVTLEVWLPYKT